MWTLDEAVARYAAAAGLCVGAQQCGCVIPSRGDARAHAGAALVRVGVSECGP